MKLATAIILSFASSAAAFTAPQVSFKSESALQAKKARPKIGAGKKVAAAPAKGRAKGGAKASARAAPSSGGGGASPSAQAWAAGGVSIALPFTKAPATLDGSMLGDVGFDPLGFSTTPVGPWFAGLEGRNGSIGNLNWYREAELIHGRIAQVAVLGFLGPGLFGTLPGNSWTGADAYSNQNPLEAFSQVPGLAILQIFLFMTFLEFKRIGYIQEQGANYQPGDLRIGQGDGRWNPLKLTYTPEEYEEKRLQELKHCRLGMVGIFGLWAQAQASGVGVIEQLSGALVAPEQYVKAGYFLPEGI